MSVAEERPSPGEVRDESTLRRWYWLRSELVDIARARGVSTGGAKLELTERIAAHLSEREAPASAKRSPRVDALPTVLRGDTVIRPGQRCTQQLREWMRSQVGPSFSFDAPMRDAVAAEGLTLDELVARWYGTRHRPKGEVAPQFELNRFSRVWHAEHPDGSHAQMLKAWQAHRSRPRD